MKTLIITIFAITLGSSLSLRAQEKHDAMQSHQHEEKGKVHEVDAFHELLHPLVHDAYPAKDFATIRKAMPGLLKSGKAIKSATLPEELSSKKSEYAKYSKKLVDQLSALDKKKGKLSDEEFGKKFMEMHDTFEEIMGIVG